MNRRDCVCDECWKLRSYALSDRAPLASCEESEARRAVATFPEHDATPVTVEVPPVAEGDS